MPQNKIKNPFSSMSNKDPNLSNIENPLFPNTGTMLSVGALEEINRLKNPIKSISSKLPKPETPSTLEDNSQSRFLASLLGQGAAMFGGAIAGRDPMKIAEQFTEDRFLQDKMTQSNEQRKSAIEQAKNLMNPDSEESKRKRMIYERALGIKIPSEFSASDLEDRNVLQGLVAQSQPKAVPGRAGGVVSQPKETKPKEEAKDQKQADIFTSNTETIKKQLEDYRNAIKAIKSPIGYAAEKAKAESIANSLLLKIKTAEKTGALDTGSISIIQSITGSPDYTRNEVIDARINQALKNLNDNVENELRGTGTINKYYKPYIPPEINDPREKAIIENYYSNPNDPENLQMYQDLINKKGY